jgi:phosphate-selective porin OprO/OprP
MRAILSLAVLAATYGSVAAAVAPAYAAEDIATPLASDDSDLAARFAALEVEVAQLKQTVEGQSAEVITPIPPSEDEMASLVEEVRALREWRESLDKAEAKAEAAASLKPTIDVKGRFFFDAYNYAQNENSVAQAGNAQNGVSLSLAWIELGGEVLENTSYRLWFDLAGQVSLLDVYLEFSELPYLQHTRVGHFFEPFGLEMMTPNKYMTFMERSSAFNIGRNTGVMAHSDDQYANWTYGLGVFVSEQGQNPPEFQDDNNATAVTGRVTYLPWFDEATQGYGVFHLGAGFSHRELADDTAQFRNRPESSLAPFLVDTGTIAADSYELVGLEAAYGYGPWMVVSEYHGVPVNTIDAGSEYLDGYYVQTSYVLTGESRPYNRRAGAFSNRIVPLENFFRVRTAGGGIGTGMGAWELAYRYSRTDLEAQTIHGGVMGVHHCGLNWYLSPYTRAQFAYITSDTDTLAASDGRLQAFQTRLQFDW